MHDPVGALRRAVPLATAIEQGRDARPSSSRNGARTHPSRATSIAGTTAERSHMAHDTVASLEGAYVGQYQPKALIYQQGAAADAVFLLQEGRVKVTATSRDGKEGVLGLFASGSFLGEGCLRDQSRRVNTATVMLHSTVVRIPKETMLTAFQADSTLATTVMLHLLDRQCRIEEDLLDHLFNNSERRLARALLLLAGLAQPRPCEVVLPYLTQETLAEIVGTTRSRVSFFMNRFRRRGFVDYDGNKTLTVRHSLLTVVQEGPPVSR